VSWTVFVIGPPENERLLVTLSDEIDEERLIAFRRAFNEWRETPAAALFLAAARIERVKELELRVPEPVAS
jgi:hypothetical protein